MIILETGFKLHNEAFLESRLKNGVNILFSDDNNKGKTLVIQGLLYSLGNEPIFPAGFDYKLATFYTKCDFDGNIWSFLRSNKTILVHGPDGINTFDSISEYKRFYSKNISPLPEITKDGVVKIVDPELFFQIFYLPQDKRNTSNILGSGYYKKLDFIEMICSMTNSKPISNEVDVADLKQQLATLKAEKSTLIKRLTFAKKHPKIAQLTQKSVDRDAAEETRKAIGAIHGRISDYQKMRNREEIRISKLQKLIGELNSLNRDLTLGKVNCADCGSNRVVYKTEDFTYDVSSNTVRSQIIESINSQIQLKLEIVEEITRDINKEQAALNKIRDATPPQIHEILLFKEEIATSSEIDEKITEINTQIDSVQDLLATAISSIEVQTQEKSSIQEEISMLMKHFYQQIDQNGIQVFDSLFTKKDETYSGSGGQEFYFSKLLAMNSALKHKYPIVIDSFRDGEISSNKELAMIGCYKQTNKQVILTSTLKSEEYSAQKYDGIQDVNPINYSLHRDNHILQSEQLSAFSKICEIFGVSTEHERV